MKNKGFTLIELLGVVVIIALLMVIVMPKIINSLKSTSLKVDDLTLKLIYNASELYVEENSEDFDEVNGNKYCIPLKELTGEGYLKSPINVNDIDITDLKSVQVTYNEGFNFELVDKNSCIVETSGSYDDGTTGEGENITQKLTLDTEYVTHYFGESDEVNTEVTITAENVDMSKVVLSENCVEGISLTLNRSTNGGTISVYALKNNISSSTTCTVKVELPNTDVYDTFKIILTQVDEDEVEETLSLYPNSFEYSIIDATSNGLEKTIDVNYTGNRKDELTVIGTECMVEVVEGGNETFELSTALLDTEYMEAYIDFSPMFDYVERTEEYVLCTVYIGIDGEISESVTYKLMVQY